MSGNSDIVLGHIRTDLEAIGFEVEKSKKKTDKIFRPITFGVNGTPHLKYEIDAYNSETKVGLEIEAGRGVQGNAIYRDLIQGMMMTNVDHLVVAVANEYWYKSKNKPIVSKDFDKCVYYQQCLFRSYESTVALHDHAHWLLILGSIHARRR